MTVRVTATTAQQHLTMSSYTTVLNWLLVTDRAAENRAKPWPREGHEDKEAPLRRKTVQYSSERGVTGVQEESDTENEKRAT